MSNTRVCSVLYLFGLRDEKVKKRDVWAPQVTSRIGRGEAFMGRLRICTQM